VSNRLFDVLACGTPVISDHLDELHDLFGDAVPTYRAPNELGALVAATLDDHARARAVAEAGRGIVLAHHTFDDRARELLELLVRHGLQHDHTTMEGRT
jgi:spore maturation protein CgeB